MRKRLSYSNVMATLAVFVALGGTSYAAAIMITGKNVKDGSLTGADIKKHSVQLNRLLGRLPAGARGPKGDQGLQGPKGDPGQDATLAAPAAWQAFPFSANYGNFTGAFVHGSYRKDQLGRVEVRGLVARNASAVPAPGDLIGTLPVGYRPVSTLIFEVAAGLANGQAARIDVAPDGTVVFMGSTSALTDPDYISLTGISFSTD